MAPHDSNVFVTEDITNRDIYNELKELNFLVKETNGRVKMNRTLITGVWMAVGFTVAGFIWIANILIEHIKIGGG